LTCGTPPTAAKADESYKSPIDTKCHHGHVTDCWTAGSVQI
jgi:hypothetical protein